MQRFRSLVDDLDDVVHLQQVIRAAVCGECPRAMHVFRHHVVFAVFLARVINRHDVGVLQPADHVRFVEKHLAGNSRTFRVIIDIDVVYLDRDVAPVVRIVRQVNRAGTPLADLVDDHVFADLVRYARISA